MVVGSQSGIADARAAVRVERRVESFILVEGSEVGLVGCGDVVMWFSGKIFLSFCGTL